MAAYCSQQRVEYLNEEHYVTELFVWNMDRLFAHREAKDASTFENNSQITVSPKSSLKWSEAQIFVLKFQSKLTRHVVYVLRSTEVPSHNRCYRGKARSVT